MNKKEFSYKLIAISLSLLMLLGFMPVSWFNAFAATDAHSDFITVSVVDESGSPVCGASVDYWIDSVEYGTDYKSGTLITNESGIVELAESSIYRENDLAVTASVSMEGYKTDCETLNGALILSEDQDFQIILESVSIPDAMIQSNNGEDTAVMAEPEVELKDISFTVIEYRGEYDGKSYHAVEIEDDLSEYQVTYALNDEEPSDTIPQICDVGKYKVTIYAQREGYKDYVKEFTNIEITAKDIDGIIVEAYRGIYTPNGEELDAVVVSGTQTGDIVTYKIGDGEWNSQCKIKDAGTYHITVRIQRSNYETKEIPVTAYIEKAERTLKFDHEHEDTVEIEGLPPFENVVLDFKATSPDAPEDIVTYTVESMYGDACPAVIEDGMLSILDAGKVKITAILVENENYKECKTECELTIVARPSTPGEYLSVKNSYMRYYLGEMKDSDFLGNVTAKVDGEITYSTDAEDLGIKCNPDNGIVFVDDYEMLAAAMDGNNGSVTIEVKAQKAATIKYKEDEVGYFIQIDFAPSPDNAYQIAGEQGAGGWYTSAVEVSASDNIYEISKICIPEQFADRVNFEDEGAGERYIYLRNKTTGAITKKILLSGLKIDTVKPDSNKISIAYSKELSDKGALFYNPDVTITFTAEDVTSGIESFSWEYARDSEASITNLDSDHGMLTAIQDLKDPTTYTAQLVLPRIQAEQLKGRLYVSATDKAGLTSEIKTDDGKIIVVDSVSPERTVSYQLKSEGGTQQTIGTQHYFSDDVEFTFDITEANFFAEDVKVTVSKNKKVAQEVPVEWKKTVQLDEYEAKLILSEEGDYIVSVAYTDRSQNEMELYESELVTVDKTRPKITISYADYAAQEYAQTAFITVTEHNFRQSDIEVETNAKDITGKDVSVSDLQEYLRTCDWVSVGDVHTARISSQFADAVYTLKLDYKDLALNIAPSAENSFIVDHTAPEAASMSVTYSVPMKESILSAITFGYYNPSVLVTFSAKDITSGVKYFTWSYQRENDVSTENVESYTNMQIAAIQDTSDKSLFTASILLPRAQAEQLRGNIAFTATDRYDNRSRKLTDTNHVIVVDTIAPTMTVEYSQANRTEKSKMYYNQAAKVIFTVAEVNFYKEDVVVELIRNKEIVQRVTPVWKDISSDEHIGTYTIKAPSNHTKDGDYVIRVSYTDRSNNKMVKYTSDTIVIDTTKPVIDVSYAKKDSILTAEDAEGRLRQYFDDTQIATVTVEEHNFKPNEVNFSVIAKDIAGNTLDADSFCKKSSWSTDRDTHTMSITYPGDANYTFDVVYADLATNEAADYEEDYFTVDKTAPAELNISYSTSILDTILEHITFGFYNAKMSVTVNAEDSVSGVSGFKYSYINASGVSSVNAELMDQIIEESEIAFSDNRQRATAMFEIPKELLGNSSQFNGTVAFTAVDRSNNESDIYRDLERVIVDSISPTATVEYNTPVQISDGVSYYDEAVEAMVTVNEANFYPEDVEVSVTKDGVAYGVSPSWSNNNTDVHTGTFALNDDGDYFITISYMDKSSNEMAVYTSEQMTVDTDIKEPIIRINGAEGNGKPFQGDVEISVDFEDVNFESYKIRLMRTSYSQKNVDVTDEFVTGYMNLTETGGEGTFSEFEKIQENDGIYTLTLSMEDKAGHASESETVFTINRFGSVYKYSDYLTDLVKDGGRYVKEVEYDLAISEYNASRLLSGTLDIQISRDGRPLEDAVYQVFPEITDQVSTGSSGWYQYQYTISKENFEDDGVYKISVSSEDAAGNTPENMNYEDKEIVFYVDDTSPEISSITGLEQGIINAMSVDVKYVVYDTIGLKSVTVYVGGDNKDNIVDEIVDFPEDANRYSGSFTLTESNSPQTVRLVVKDLAENVTDTNSEKFESEYVFHKSVTVSTNFFVRFLANKLLLWKIIGSIVVLCAIVVGFIVWKRRKDGMKSDGGESGNRQ